MMDKDLIKKATAILNEIRGLGSHSFGAEPPVNEYIAGLNRADKLHQGEAAELLANTANISGGFHAPVEHEKWKGTYKAEGHGAFDGYHHTWLPEGKGHLHYTVQNPSYIYAPDKKLIGFVSGVGDKWSAELAYGQRLSDNIKIPFNDQETALRYVALAHQHGLVK